MNEVATTGETDQYQLPDGHFGARTAVTGISLPTELLEDIRALSRKQNVSVSALVRSMIKHCLGHVTVEGHNG